MRDQKECLQDRLGAVIASKRNGSGRGGSGIGELKTNGCTAFTKTVESMAKTHTLRNCRFITCDDILLNATEKTLDLMAIEGIELPAPGVDMSVSLKGKHDQWCVDNMETVRKGINESRNYVIGQAKAAINRIETECGLKFTTEMISLCAQRKVGNNGVSKEVF